LDEKEMAILATKEATAYSFKEPIIPRKAWRSSLSPVLFYHPQFVFPLHPFSAHDFTARDPSLTILRCQNFVVCVEEHIIFVLLGYHRSFRDKRGAIDWTVAQNSQNFVERNKSYLLL
jgi:hypothetical protein